MKYYAITYDTPDDKRRNAIANVLKRYGERVQYSVFEAEMPKRLCDRMVDELERIIDEEEDSVFVYELVFPPRRLKGRRKTGPGKGFVV